MSQRYVMCINNEGYPLDLTVHKVYRVLPDEAAERHGQIRIVDDSGEDYLHSAKRFVPVELSPASEEAFARVTA